MNSSKRLQVKFPKYEEIYEGGKYITLQNFDSMSN